MIQIFKWLRGHRLNLDLGIGYRWDDMYDGYLIVFYHRPQLVWSEPSKPNINTDEIPF